MAPFREIRESFVEQMFDSWLSTFEKCAKPDRVKNDIGYVIVSVQCHFVLVGSIITRSYATRATSYRYINNIASLHNL